MTPVCRRSDFVGAENAVANNHYIKDGATGSSFVVYHRLGLILADSGWAGMVNHVKIA